MPKRKPGERLYFLCTGECVSYDELHEHANSHILGHLRYVKDEGREITTLALYLTPVSAAQVPPINPVIVADIIGDARNIKCRYADCTRSQRWEIGKAGFLALMDRMGLQEKALENANR